MIVRPSASLLRLRQGKATQQDGQAIIEYIDALNQYIKDLEERLDDND